MRWVIVAVGALSLAGCNQKGTCVRDGKSSAANSCATLTAKKFCPGDFYAEDGTAGMLHCKTLGFDKNASSGKSDPDQPQLYFRSETK
ncbi:MAG TPA: hypothetical protein VIF62_39570 [Labilithrix sp.]|jgi:hypothetical protein